MQEPIIVAQQVHLAARPRGLPALADFAMVEAPLPAPAEGEGLVRNRWRALDPHVRLRMGRGDSSHPPFALGQVLEGAAIGEVLVSRTPRFRGGDLVRGAFGWRDFYVARAGQVEPIDTAADPDLLPELRLGVLAPSGLAAFARAHGCHVVATAGGEAQRAWLERELGVVALDCRADDFDERAASAFPNGVDVYLDTVGGELLRVALEHMNDFGRIISCGMMDQYNDSVPRSGPLNLHHVVARRRAEMTPHHRAGAACGAAGVDRPEAGADLWQMPGPLRMTARAGAHHWAGGALPPRLCATRSASSLCVWVVGCRVSQNR